MYAWLPLGNSYQIDNDIQADSINLQTDPITGRIFLTGPKLYSFDPVSKSWSALSGNLPIWPDLAVDHLGRPVVVYRGNNLSVRRYNFETSSLENLGDNVAPWDVTKSAVAVDNAGNIYAAGLRNTGGSGTISVKKRNASNGAWETISDPSFAITGVSYSRMSMKCNSSGHLLLLVRTGDFEQKVFRFDGSGWSIVGAPLPIYGDPKNILIGPSDEIIVNNIDPALPLYSGNGGLPYVKTFDGSQWVDVGTFPVQPANAFFTGACLDGQGRLILAASQGWDSVKTYRLEGGVWQDIGTVDAGTTALDLGSGLELSPVGIDEFAVAGKDLTGFPIVSFRDVWDDVNNPLRPDYTLSVDSSKIVFMSSDVEADGTKPVESYHYKVDEGSFVEGNKVVANLLEEGIHTITAYAQDYDQKISGNTILSVEVNSDPNVTGGVDPNMTPSNYSGQVYFDGSSGLASFNLVSDSVYVSGQGYIAKEDYTLISDGIQVYPQGYFAKETYTLISNNVQVSGSGVIFREDYGSLGLSMGDRVRLSHELYQPYTVTITNVSDVGTPEAPQITYSIDYPYATNESDFSATVEKVTSISLGLSMGDRVRLSPDPSSGYSPYTATIMYVSDMGTLEDPQVTYAVDFSLPIEASAAVEKVNYVSLGLSVGDRVRLSPDPSSPYQPYTTTINYVSEMGTPEAPQITYFYEYIPFSGVSATAEKVTYPSVFYVQYNSFDEGMAQLNGLTLVNNDTELKILTLSLDPNSNPEYASIMSYDQNWYVASGTSLLPGKSFSIVTDVSPNYAPASITLSNSSINENAGPDAFVGYLSAADTDGNDTHTFSMVEGEGDTDNNLFFIYNNALGAFESLSYADGATRSIRVRADDGNGGTVEEIFVISVISLNNAPTDITLSNSSVNEGAGANATVGTLSAVDADEGDTHTFSLVAGLGDTDNDLFNISGNELRATNSLVYADSATRSVRVQADDGNGGTFEEAFVIDVIQVPVPPNPTGHFQTIKLRKGLKQNLPETAAEGEPLFATDTGELFVGTGSAVVPVIGDVNDDSISKEKLNEDVAGAGLVQDVDGSLAVNVGDGLQINGETSDLVSVKVDDTSMIVSEDGISVSTIDGGEF